MERTHSIGVKLTENERKDNFVCQCYPNKTYYYHKCRKCGERVLSETKIAELRLCPDCKAI